MEAENAALPLALLSCPLFVATWVFGVTGWTAYRRHVRTAHPKTFEKNGSPVGLLWWIEGPAHTPSFRRFATAASRERTWLQRPAAEMKSCDACRAARMGYACVWSIGALLTVAALLSLATMALQP